jgi:hypothetical protein
MTLHSQYEFSIPEETARVARAAYPKGNLSMKMRDALGTIYQDESFAHLFPTNGRPMDALSRLLGGWRSSQLCSLSRDCPIDKPPTRFEGGSI